MLGIFKNKPKGEEITLKIEGMHCTSCAMNIDGELEDLPGVHEASTSYAKSATKIKYDSVKVKKDQLLAAIKKAGYQVK